jgi:hypothetical protein
MTAHDNVRVFAAGLSPTQADDSGGGATASSRGILQITVRRAGHR